MRRNLRCAFLSCEVWRHCPDCRREDDGRTGLSARPSQTSPLPVPQGPVCRWIVLSDRRRGCGSPTPSDDRMRNPLQPGKYFRLGMGRWVIAFLGPRERKPNPSDHGASLGTIPGPNTLRCGHFPLSSLSAGVRPEGHSSGCPAGWQATRSGTPVVLVRVS